MQILFITTLPNRILEFLQDRQDVTLNVVDCSSFIQQKIKKDNMQNVKNTILSAIQTAIGAVEADMILTYRCPCILPPAIFQKAKKGAFNIHPSLLPKYPGTNPWKSIYENKEKESGVTIHAIDEGIDTGAIILQRKFEVYLDKDVEWHRDVVDKQACEMLDDLLFALNDENGKIFSCVINENDCTNATDISKVAKRFFASGYIYDKMKKPEESKTNFERAIELYKRLAVYYESQEKPKNALIQYTFILTICLKIYGQKNEQTALCYEKAAFAEAKLGMESTAINSLNMANAIREKVYGYNHDRYIQGLQKMGEISFLIKEYKDNHKGDE